MHTAVIDSPVGRLRLQAEEDALCLLTRTDAPLCPPASPLLRRCETQLCEYFAGTRTVFDLPLRPAGTPFQLRVWRALTHIPFGATCSYGEIAHLIGQPTASRAVGGALHRNPIWIILPCHRVTGAKGQLTGYAGGVDMKEWLLDHERQRCK